MKKIAAFMSIILALSLVFLLTFGCGTDSPEKERESIGSTGAQTVRVTFPEGYTVMQTAELLEEKGVCSFDEFIAAVNGYEGELKPENPGERPFMLEGYIFPDTYDFYIGESAQRALGRFLTNYSSKITDSDTARAAQLGYSMDEILKIASVIQEEAGIESEMAKVSSVLHNRLEDSYGKLECNVTFEYVNNCIVPFLMREYGEGTTDAEGEYTAEYEAAADGIEEEYDALFDTYRFSGLPAGAICNPGYAAIRAALYPEDTDYFFFFTDKDFVYHYSETYSEHRELIKQYGLSS